MLESRELASSDLIDNAFDRNVGKYISFDCGGPLVRTDELEQFVRRRLSAHDGQNVAASVKGSFDSSKADVAGRSYNENGFRHGFEIETDCEMYYCANEVLRSSQAV